MVTMNEKDTRSAAILKGISERISQKQFETWFRGLQLTFMPPDEVRISVPNKFHQVWIEKRYQSIIIETVRQLADVSARIFFVIEPPLKKSMALDNEPPPEEDSDPFYEEPEPAADGDYLGQPLNKEYTFENFVVGPSNHFCHAATRAVSEKPGDTYNPLFIHGNSGLGKTHLLQALCHSLKRKQLKICFLSCEDFTNHFINSIESGNLESFRWHYRHVDVLAIDDVHFLSQKERTQEEFFHTFNTLYNKGKQIILTSDRHPKDIADVEDRLVSRFKWGLVIHLEPPPLETRIAIVKRKARLRGFELSDMASHFIGERIKENVRELEGAVNRVIYLSRLSNKAVDMELLNEALVDLLPGAVLQMGPSLSDILHITAESFNVRPTDIQSRKQTKMVAYPRQICMFLARECTPSSLEEIGVHFGGRDHATVHYAIRKITKLRDKDPSVAHFLENMKTRLKKKAL